MVWEYGAKRERDREREKVAHGNLACGPRMSITDIRRDIVWRTIINLRVTQRAAYEYQCKESGEGEQKRERDYRQLHLQFARSAACLYSI